MRSKRRRHLSPRTPRAIEKLRGQEENAKMNDRAVSQMVNHDLMLSRFGLGESSNFKNESRCGASSVKR